MSSKVLAASRAATPATPTIGSNATAESTPATSDRMASMPMALTPAWRPSLYTQTGYAAGRTSQRRTSKRQIIAAFDRIRAEKVALGCGVTTHRSVYSPSGLYGKWVGRGLAQRAG